jgi:hypothetical protein
MPFAGNFRLRRRLRLMIVAPAGLLLGACDGIKVHRDSGDFASSYDDNEVYKVPAPSPDTVPAGMVVEVQFTLADPETATTCPADSYIWPSGCVDTSAPVTGQWSAGATMVGSWVGDGVYDVTLTFQETGDSTPVSTGNAPSLTIDETGVDVGITMNPASPLAMAHIHLSSVPAARPDGDICAGTYDDAQTCTSSDPVYTCTVAVPQSDGSPSAYTAKGCDKGANYANLQGQICTAGEHMQQSAFAAAFKCE